MEEILELKYCLQNQQYDRALTIVKQLEAMGKQDKINDLESLLVVLLIHLIEIQVKKRVTINCKNAITHSILAIQKRNRLGKNYCYIEMNSWNSHISNCQFEAMLGAVKEAFEEADYKDLEKLVNFQQLVRVSNELLSLTYTSNPREIIKKIDRQFPVKRF